MLCSSQASQNITAPNTATPCICLRPKRAVMSVKTHLSWRQARIIPWASPADKPVADEEKDLTWTWSSSITGSLVLVDLSAVLFRFVVCRGFGLATSGNRKPEKYFHCLHFRRTTEAFPSWKRPVRTYIAYLSRSKYLSGLKTTASLFLAQNPLSGLLLRIIHTK